MTFPIVVGVATLPFLGNTSKIQPRLDNPATLFGLGFIGLILIALACVSWVGVKELLYFRKAPALIFSPKTMLYRKLGGAQAFEIRYAEIEQFFLKEIEHKGRVSTFLVIEGKAGESVEIPCDKLTIPARDLERMVIERTPDISYQSVRREG